MFPTEKVNGRRGIDRVCLEAQGQGTVLVQQRALDHGRVGQQQVTGPGGVEPCFLRFRQGAEGGATGVEQGFPAQLGEPEIELFRGQTVGAVIMKAVIDTRLIQPLAGLLDGVAVLDAIEGGGHGDPLSAGLGCGPEIVQGARFWHCGPHGNAHGRMGWFYPVRPSGEGRAAHQHTLVWDGMRCGIKGETGAGGPYAARLAG